MSVQNEIASFRGVPFGYRPGTTDWNTIYACVVDDEYGLADEDMSDKLVFDIGAHVGGVAVWCASRGARVVAVEAIPENVTMIRGNALLGGHHVLVEQAALTDTDGTVEFGWGVKPEDMQNETRVGHQFIGGTGNHDGQRHTVPAVTLSTLCEKYGTPEILKLDCEGGEWAAVKDPAIQEIPLIVGEWHPVEGHTLAEFAYRMERSHMVEFSGPEAGPGGFRATLYP